MTEFVSGLEAIHIVGKGPSWGASPKKHDPKVEELWGVNGIFMDHPYIDRSFMLHDPRQEIIFEARDMLDRIRNIDHPIYMNRTHDGKTLGSKVREFPAEWVRSQWPRDYYTNVVCWMIALAILMEPKALYLWGVDMLTPREYANERGAVEYWTGIAIGKGIPVAIPDTSAICTTKSRWGYCYGYVLRRKPSGLIYDLIPDFDGFNKPEILDDYVLITREEYVALTGSDTSKRRVEGNTGQEPERPVRETPDPVEHRNSSEVGR